MSKKNHITQCHNCQMFGHGSSRCKVNTFCANCAGRHKTEDCKETAIKCANCNGQHKSTDQNCPNKIQYLNIKEKNKPLHKKSVKFGTSLQNEKNFPDTLQQNIRPITPIWNYSSRNKNEGNNYINLPQNPGELFTMSELQQLTLELITNLKNCKNKFDQFEVITKLACKFLS